MVGSLRVSTYSSSAASSSPSTPANLGERPHTYSTPSCSSSVLENPKSYSFSLTELEQEWLRIFWLIYCEDIETLTELIEGKTRKHSPSPRPHFTPPSTISFPYLLPALPQAKIFELASALPQDFCEAFDEFELNGDPDWYPHSSSSTTSSTIPFPFPSSPPPPHSTSDFSSAATSSSSTSSSEISSKWSGLEVACFLGKDVIVRLLLEGLMPPITKFALKITAARGFGKVISELFRASIVRKFLSSSDSSSSFSSSLETSSSIVASSSACSFLSDLSPSSSPPTVVSSISIPSSYLYGESGIVYEAAIRGHMEVLKALEEFYPRVNDGRVSEMMKASLPSSLFVPTLSVSPPFSPSSSSSCSSTAVTPYGPLLPPPPSSTVAMVPRPLTEVVTPYGPLLLPPLSSASATPALASSSLSSSASSSSSSFSSSSSSVSSASSSTSSSPTPSLFLPEEGIGTIAREALCPAVNQNNLEVLKWTINAGAMFAVRTKREVSSVGDAAVQALDMAVRKGFIEAAYLLQQAGVPLKKNILTVAVASEPNENRLAMIKHLLSQQHRQRELAGTTKNVEEFRDSLSEALERLLFNERFSEYPINTSTAKFLLRKGAGISLKAQARAACVVEDNLWCQVVRFIRTRNQLLHSQYARRDARTVLHLFFEPEHFKNWCYDWSQAEIEVGTKRHLDAFPEDVFVTDWKGYRPLNFLLDKASRAATRRGLLQNSSLGPFSSSSSSIGKELDFLPLIRLLVDRSAPLPDPWEITPKESELLEQALQSSSYMEKRKRKFRENRMSYASRISPMPLMVLCLRSLNSNREKVEGSLLSSSSPSLLTLLFLSLLHMTF
jgi:hypothetical protein